MTEDLVTYWLQGSSKPEASKLPPWFLTSRAAADPGIPGKGTEGEPGAGSEEAGELAETGIGASP